MAILNVVNSNVPIPNVVKLNVSIPNVVRSNVAILNVVKLNVSIPNVVRSNVAILNVVKATFMQLFTWPFRTCGNVSLRKKRPELEMRSKDYDLILLSETWLNPEDRWLLRNFDVIRSDRDARRGGGMAIMIRNGIKYQIIYNLYNANKKLEICGIKTVLNSKNIAIVSVYRPPQAVTLTHTILYGAALIRAPKAKRFWIFVWILILPSSTMAQLPDLRLHTHKAPQSTFRSQIVLFALGGYQGIMGQ
ncbi:rna-directed dna polymerase from mobile element jockey [Lasius niger]|uniref:Rna-directed dna polymerase from mobile element jockey n=1 Tax=Lasius niger TaxID=67767 RepID=A0A0J7K8Q9_LASNI|nr:rna-directed dna polymerase from mobile element jockey [Lasius niger]